MAMQGMNSLGQLYYLLDKLRLRHYGYPYQARDFSRSSEEDSGK